MRRKDREVTDSEGVRSILEQCKTCHVAMLDGETPYALPLSFGYELVDGALTLYFHSAREGRKLDVLRRNNRVGFSMCHEGEPTLGANPCNSGYYYASVVGIGTVAFVDDATEKCRALSLLMRRQAGKQIAFTPAQADTVCVFTITSTDFTGKRKPRPAAD